MTKKLLRRRSGWTSKTLLKNSLFWDPISCHFETKIGPSSMQNRSKKMIQNLLASSHRFLSAFWGVLRGSLGVTLFRGWPALAVFFGPNQLKRRQELQNSGPRRSNAPNMAPQENLKRPPRSPQNPYVPGFSCPSFPVGAPT